MKKHPTTRRLARFVAAGMAATLGGVALMAQAASAAPTPGWELTVYYTPSQAYFNGTPTPTNACDGSSLGNLPADFLAEVGTQGSGQLSDGRFVQDGGGCLNVVAQPFTSSGAPATAFHSAAGHPNYQGQNFKITDCGTGVDPTACQKIKSASWQVTDSFAATGPTNHLDLYIGVQGRDFSNLSTYMMDPTDATVDMGGTGNSCDPSTQSCVTDGTRPSSYNPFVIAYSPWIPWYFSVQVAGGGFGPNSPITVEVDSDTNTWADGHVSTDGSGNFTANVMVDPSACGQQVTAYVYDYGHVDSDGRPNVLRAGTTVLCDYWF